MEKAYWHLYIYTLCEACTRLNWFGGFPHCRFSVYNTVALTFDLLPVYFGNTSFEYFEEQLSRHGEWLQVKLELYIACSITDVWVTQCSVDGLSADFWYLWGHNKWSVRNSCNITGSRSRAKLCPLCNLSMLQQQIVRRRLVWTLKFHRGFCETTFQVWKNYSSY